ncbi:MAG TPA: hypothetical protein VFF15_02935 [Flavobacteriaceae bacterium]|nr:hypothetical protein [Flavobacteriaceae bacterium]
MNRKMKDKTSKTKNLKAAVLGGFVLLFSCSLVAQVTTTVDTTTIKIGEQILYKIQMETDTTNLVVFPEGQTFSPFEVNESMPVDTIINQNKATLIKKYGLTLFDSGSYYIPKQKIQLNNNTVFTDSLKIQVNAVQVDTTKQGLYNIKPLLEVEKPKNNTLIYMAIALCLLALMALLIYRFIWRNKPLTEEEKIALLPPYDRAKLVLKNLEDSKYLQTENLKEFYSELTFALRKYLDEKVYDRALESTSDELVFRLQVLKDANQIKLSSETINNIESILKRADLVKFAKSKPDIELAKIDRITIDKEIDHVKELLPEPTEEEKRLDQQYREEQERRQKRKKRMRTAGAVAALLLVIYTVAGIKYGFTYVNDTLTAHQGKKLLEKTWVTSEYGFPPIHISTPEVLKRTEVQLPEELKDKMKMTSYSYEKKGILTLVLSTTTIAQPQDSLDLSLAIEGNLKTLEEKGAKNILTKNDKFTTPNGAEGIKTYGSLQLPVEENADRYTNANYAILSFTSNNKVIQQIVLTWRDHDKYTAETAERIINSLELQEKTE